MTKLQFILSLHEKLSGLPRQEVEERLVFYSEMIEDRMEDGLSEEEAVAAVGTVEEVAAQIVADIPLAKIAKEKLKPKRRLRVWEITLLVLGSPVWLSLLIAGFAVVLSVYVSFWAVIVSFWAVFGSLAACGGCGIAVGIGLILAGNSPLGAAFISAAIVCAGLSIAFFFGCKALTKAALLLTKKLALWTKNCFVKKEGA